MFKPISALSGGERARVALAKLTLQGANFLVLDEPTNHLDLPARQVLEAILASYDGTLIFVSHDRYFVDALATRLWVLEDGAIATFEGNYTAYRTRAARTAAAAKAQAVAAANGRANGLSGAPSPRGVGAPHAVRGGGEGLRRSVERVEDEIAAQEARMAQLEADLTAASEAADVERITALGEEYAQAKERLDLLYNEWHELAS